MARRIRNRISPGCFRSARGSAVIMSGKAQVASTFPDPVHRRDRWTGIVQPPICRQRHRVGTFEMAVATSEYLSARRNGRIDHRFQHSVATTTGLPAPRHRASFVSARRHFFQRHFHAEISARNHQCVGEIHDFVEAIDRLGFSIFAMTAARPRVIFFASARSSGRWMNDNATQSMPVSSACFKVRPVFIGQS